MTDEAEIKPNSSYVEDFMHSNIIRILFGLLILLLYYFFLSPKVENLLTYAIANSVKGASTSAVNTLTPVFDIHVYSGTYNLSSDIGSSTLISKTKFFTIDARIVALNKFLIDYHSPMAQYAQTFIDEADKYGLDWRLVASISGVESAFGNLIPAGTHNGWGWRGINKNSAGWSVFATWNDGIKEVTRGLAQGYGTNLTPFEIEPAYCPPCAEGSAHAWANGVTRFMNELDYYVDNLDNL